VEDRRHLQEETLFGVDKKPMPYLLGTMNLLLHGLDRPNLVRDNALSNPLTQITDRARYNVIMTNPPFGGEEEKGIQENFPEATRASETALLFLQFIMRSLKRGGRCGMVVPNGTLFGDGVCARIKKELLDNFNLHTIVRLPNGVFAPYTSIPTNLIFFDRTGPTKEIWYYEHPLPEGRKNYTKTQPLQFEEFAPCQTWWSSRHEIDRAWLVPVDQVLKTDADGRSVVNLDLKNPRGKQDFEHMPPEQLVNDILEKERRITALLEDVRIALSEEKK